MVIPSSPYWLLKWGESSWTMGIEHILTSSGVTKVSDKKSGEMETPELR